MSKGIVGVSRQSGIPYEPNGISTVQVCKKKFEVMLSLLRLLVIISISSKIFLRRKSLQNSARGLFFLPDTEFCEPNGLPFLITYSGSKIYHDSVRNFSVEVYAQWRKRN